ncbi:NTP transferase domain-containing protein [Candidatus Woesearchaeota archaeon]|nr:NTP transferase domain-containing protein [Candidatus Woesearchaeota archaeon]
MPKITSAVMLAAGKSTRTYPLTLTRPKPLLKVRDKTILEHNLEQLQGLVEEVILIIGYRAAQMQEAAKQARIPVRCIVQEQQLGTGHALLQAEQFIDGDFLVLGGDDIFHHGDIKRCMQHAPAVLAQRVAHPERFGVFLLNGKYITKVIEKPKEFVSDLANTGCYAFPKSIFPILHQLQPSPRGEIELTDALNVLAAQQKVSCVRVQRYWLPIGYPWSLLDAQKKLGAAVSIGKGCAIAKTARISNSILMDACTVGEHAHIFYSVIGNNVHIGNNVKILYKQREPVQSLLNGVWVDTGRKMLGAIIGDNVTVKPNTIIHPGIKISPNQVISGEIRKDQ